jgi:hypothetical protein
MMRISTPGSALPTDPMRRFPAKTSRTLSMAIPPNASVWPYAWRTGIPNRDSNSSRSAGVSGAGRHFVEQHTQHRRVEREIVDAVVVHHPLGKGTTEFTQ